MNRSEMINFKNLTQIENFKKTMMKFCTNQSIEEDEKIYILSSALLFLKNYENDKRHTSYFEFSYYIILKYSIEYHDYRPLYDFSINFGFYPIARYIMKNQLLLDTNYFDDLLDKKLDNFSYNGHIETLEQSNNRKQLLDDTTNEICYLAPTSFGKSSIIVEHIKTHDRINQKIGIIVPTKSLLMQTYKLIRESNLKKRILIHDEMYTGENSFIAVFTQERALRLLDKNNVVFDILFIDEAHNIFDNSSRSILLTRLIRKSKTLNKNLKIIYLSPLINDTNNLKIETYQDIKEQKINFNIKEPEIYEYSLDNTIYKYNRFLDLFNEIGFEKNMLSYLTNNSKEKNFIYIRSPKKIEDFSKLFAKNLNLISNNPEIEEIIEILKENVHEDFNMINLLKKGILYLHGQLPNAIKEYLESKYKVLASLKYIVANTVVLEGMNLPINALFILNTYSLDSKKLNNLIGRVNRLNEVFSNTEKTLEKLLPKIHFVNNTEFNGVNGNMRNKIKYLRNKSFSDKISNPTLSSFNIDKVDIKNTEKIKLIIANEIFISKEQLDEKSQVKSYFIKNGFNEFYRSFDNSFDIIYEKIGTHKNDSSFKKLPILEKISTIFIEGVPDIVDFEIKRLNNIEARNFYEAFIKNSHNHPLKVQITSMYQYFLKRINNDDAIFYIGESYGEIEKETINYSNYNRKVYINLKSKTAKELINLAVVKIEIENKFISFKLNKFITLLFDYDLISEEEYHINIYGTNDKKKVELSKLGLSINLITKLENDGQIKNITIDKYNNLSFNSDFKTFKNAINDFYRFEIERYFYVE